MALTQADCSSLLDYANDDTDQLVYTFTMDNALLANRLALIHFRAQSVNDVNPNPTSVLISGITATQVSDTLVTANAVREYIYRALGGSPSGTDLVLTFSPASGNIAPGKVQGLQWNNVDTGGVNGANALV